MLSKYIFLLLSAILLVQCSNGKSLTSSNGSDDSTANKNVQSSSSELTSAEQSDERFERFKFALEKHYDNAVRTLKAGQKLLRNVVAEASKIEDKSDKITEKIEKCLKLAEKLEALNQNYDKLSEREKIKQIVNALVELGVLLDKYDATRLGNPSSDDQLFSDLLDKNGLEEVVNAFNNISFPNSNDDFNAARKSF